MEEDRPFSRAGKIEHTTMPVRPHRLQPELMPADMHDSQTEPSPDVSMPAEADVPPAAEQATEDGPDEEHVEPNQSVKKSPMAPSKAMRDVHEAMGHAVFRNWCGACIKGRGRNDSHCRKERGEGETPVLSWDYGFLSAKGTETKAELEELARSGQSPVLCSRDRCSGSCF